MITYEQAKMALYGAVDQRGADYVYDQRVNDRCVYLTPEGKPSCIVAVALVNLGVPVDHLPPADNFQPNPYGLLSNDDNVPLGAELDAISLLNMAQEAQDAGTPWGRAVEESVAHWDFVRTSNNETVGV